MMDILLKMKSSVATWIARGLLIAIFMVGIYLFVTKDDWMLSIYSEGQTQLRLEYDSLEACMSSGNSFLLTKSVERFDCGLNCQKSNNLKNAVLCEEVCDSNGCRD